LASVDRVLSEDRRQLAHRARPGFSACRSAERQSATESRAMNSFDRTTSRAWSQCSADHQGPDFRMDVELTCRGRRWLEGGGYACMAGEGRERRLRQRKRPDQALPKTAETGARLVISQKSLCPST